MGLLDRLQKNKTNNNPKCTKCKKPIIGERSIPPAWRYLYENKDYEELGSSHLVCMICNKRFCGDCAIYDEEKDRCLCPECGTPLATVGTSR